VGRERGRWGILRLEASGGRRGKKQDKFELIDSNKRRKINGADGF
jgi:hypothetical protein